MIRVSAPARANLLGNPSDQYGGATLSCSVPLRAWAEVAPGAGVASTADAQFQLGEDGALAPRGDDFDLSRAVLRHLGGPSEGVDLRFGSEIPRQSGMAGSTALVVVLLAALLRARDETWHPYALAERARLIEREELGIQCGFVDQYLTVFGGLRYVDLRGKAHDGEDLPPYATVEDLAPVVPRLPFLLAFSGVQHSSDAVHRPLRQRWLDGEPACVEGYARVTELAREGKRALIDGDLAALAACMNENHAIQRGLGGSGEVNDRLIDAALGAGAAAAKLAGAGNGGTIVVLEGSADRARLEAALRAEGAVAFYRPEVVPGLCEETASPSSAGITASG